MTITVSRSDWYQRIVGGDEIALRDVFRAYGATAREIARRIVGPDQADDLVEEVFLLIWTEPQQWASPALDVHVLRITRDLSLAVLRRGIVPRLAALDLQPFTIPPDQSTPDIVHQINHDELQRAMLTLPGDLARQLEDAWLGGVCGDDASLATALDMLVDRFRSGRLDRREP